MSDQLAGNNGAPRNPADAGQTRPTARGRPRVWSNEREKERGHRARRAERADLVAELLLAVRNAEVSDATLHQAAVHGDDTALLRALIHYYQVRNWNLLQWQEDKRREATDAAAAPDARAPPAPADPPSST